MEEVDTLRHVRGALEHPQEGPRTERALQDRLRAALHHARRVKVALYAHHVAEDRERGGGGGGGGREGRSHGGVEHQVVAGVDLRVHVEEVEHDPGDIDGDKLPDGHEVDAEVS